MKKHIVIKISAGIIILVVAIFHIIWFINYNQYKPYVDAVGKDEWGNYLYVDENKTAYSVFPPNYPRFVGNLSICDSRGKDLKQGDIIVDMIIWPNYKDSFEIGISINKVKNNITTEDENSGSYSFSANSANFELNEKCEFLKEYSKEEIELFNQNKDIIDEYYAKAYDMWGILGKS